jgi:hypothetical protein
MVDRQPAAEGSRRRIGQPATVTAMTKLLQQRPAPARLLTSRRRHRTDLAIVHIHEGREDLAAVQLPQGQQIKPHPAATGPPR